jgi:tetratricopeptide (TPR) repeat protein
VSQRDYPLDPPATALEAQREKEAPQRPGRDAFDLVVTVCAVLTTLLAAVVALLHADASREEERAATDAQAAAIAASRTTVSARTDAHAELARLEAVAEYAAREGSLRQRRLVLPVRGSAALEHWHDLRKATTRELSPDARDAFARDPYFPGGYLDEQTHEAAELGAWRDALNDYSGQWGKRAALYMGLLTVLAVALYLLGFSLTRPGRHMRGVFAAVGAVFLLAGLVFGPLQWAFPPKKPPERAATEYAAGVREYVSAATPRDYQRAERHFDAAIEAWPRFARAYLSSADAHNLATSPQVALFMSLTPPAARRQAIRDYEKARELGFNTPGVKVNLGFDRWVLGLEESRDELVREALGLTETAIAEDRTDPVPRFNKAVGLLSVGRVRAALAAYTKALRVALRNERFDVYAAGWQSGALTDLELARRYSSPALAPAILRAKQLVAGSFEARSIHEPRKRGSLSVLGASVDPGYAYFSVDDERGLGRDPDYSVHWYSLLPGLGWAHMSEFSDVPGEDLDQSFYGSLVRVTVPPRCFTAGRYRVEIYVDGRLAGEAEARNDFGGFRPVVERQLGIAACVPPALSRRPAAARVGELARATYMGRYVRSGDPARGELIVVRLNDHALGSRELATGDALARVVRSVADTRRLELRPAESSAGYLQDLLDTRSRAYRYAGGELHASAGRDWDGSLVVAIAVGPASWYRTESPDIALSSVAPIYFYPPSEDG